MTRIFTPPDLDFDRTIPKVFIRNCPWTVDQFTTLTEHLSDKLYDIYVYNDSMNDIQWAEGIRNHAVKTYDLRSYQDIEPVDLLRKIDNDF
jgi:hypothetical protein